MKQKKVVLMTAVFSMLATTTAFAGTWRAGDGANQGKWWYDNGNGTYAGNGWQWIDGNGDGISESYYFDENGWLLTNTSTPDGYKVDANGAWIQDGVVQTKAISAAAAPINESDFIVSGDNSVTRNSTDNSVISIWEHSGYSASAGGWVHQMFVTGDSVTTARGITLGNAKSDVVAKYGDAVSQKFDGNSDRHYQQVVSMGHPDAFVIAGSAYVMEYKTNPYGIRFYFNQQDKVIGIVYFRDLTMDDTQSAGENLVGTYNYSQSIVYVFNNETQKYEVYGKTPEHTNFDWSEDDYGQFDEMLNERMQQFGFAADFAPEYKVLETSNDVIKVTHCNTDWIMSFKNQGNAWRFEGYESNGSYESNPDDNYTLAFGGGKLIEGSYGSDEGGIFFPEGTKWYQEMIYVKE